MPLITVRAQAPLRQEVIPRIVNEIRESGAQALGCPTSNLWVTVREEQTADHPPVALIHALSGRTRNEKETLVRAVAAAVGRGLSVDPKSVWIYYQEMDPQEVWFEGHWAATL